MPICRTRKNGRRSTPGNRTRLTASNEGMEGDNEGLDQSDTHRLAEVMRAKANIRAKPKHRPSH